jgi:hypothetical protein
MHAALLPLFTFILMGFRKSSSKSFLIRNFSSSFFLNFTPKFELWDVRTAPALAAFLVDVRTTVLVVQVDEH